MCDVKIVLGMLVFAAVLLDACSNTSDISAPNQVDLSGVDSDSMYQTPIVRTEIP